MWLNRLFGKNKVVIGMVHVGPLPGSPNYEGGLNEVVKRAVLDAKALAEGGVDGIMIENFNDAPFPKTKADPATVASMTLIASEVKDVVDVPIGINILRNCALDALAVAYVLGASFVRINALSEVIVADQGVIEPIAYELMRYRKYLGASNIKVLADVHVKHAIPLAPRDIELVARDAVERGLADAIIVSGRRTGEEADLNKVKLVKSALGNTPVFVGSGITSTNVRSFLNIADGVIVGTYFKRDGRVDPEKVRKLMRIVEGLR